MSSVVISGDTSGTVTLQAPATAGSTILTLPSTSGTVVTTAGGTTGSFTTLTSSADATFATSSGNVGIGTTSPTSKLHLTSSSNVEMRVTCTSGTNQFVDFGTGTGGTHYVYGYGAYPLVFGTNSAERMRIASDGTVTIPKGVSGTPAFAAYQSSAQSIGAATWTKLQFQTEEYDTNSNFDTSTYRFTPTVAGYYQINGAWQFGSGAANTQCTIYKNGSAYKSGPSWAGGTGYGGIISSVVYFNGSTDYVELYAYTNTAKTALAQIDTTFFNGVLVRGA